MTMQEQLDQTPLLLPARPYDERYISRGISLGFAFDMQKGEHSFASDRVSYFTRRPNSLSIVPEGCEIYSQSDHGGEYLIVRVPSELNSVSIWRNSEVLNDLVIPIVSRSAKRIRQLLLKPSKAQGDLVQVEVSEFCLHVMNALMMNGGQAFSPRWLTKRRLRIIDDYIQAKLDQEIRIGDLAAELGLSPGYFARMFQAGTAMSPHRYVMSRRIARARSLCVHSNQSLSQIAMLTGFSSQAHMTTAFRREIGLSPNEVRKIFTE